MVLKYACGLCAAILLFLGWPSGQLAHAQSASAQPSKLLESADRIAKKVSALRGLAIKVPIKRDVMNKKQILARLRLRVDSEYSKGEIEGEELMLKRFGLLSPETNYLKLVLDLLTEQVAGFYDPFERQLYIADWISMGGDFVMSHEIDHALQDQHFNLKKFLHDVKGDSDAALARQALVEGDGMAASIEFLMDVAGRQVPWGQDGFTEQFVAGVRQGMSTLGDVPLVLRESLMFPYSAGLGFVAHYRRHHPWSRIDQIFQKPPLSSEQVLHPDKYDLYERPLVVKGSAPKALTGYRSLHNNTVGEFGARVFLLQHGVDEKRALQATAGWGGDRVILLAPKSHKQGVEGVVGINYTVFDTEADAIEYMSALGLAMPALSAGPSLGRTKKLIRFSGKNGVLFAAERRGDAVLLLAGAPLAKGPAIRKQVWKTWKVRGRGGK